MSIVAACIQLPIRAGEVEANTDAALTRIAEAVHAGAQLVVLPDLWTTGERTGRAIRDSELSEGAVDEVRRLARRHRVVIVGSVIAATGGLIHDQAHVIESDGELIGSYRRVHDLTHGSSGLSAGDETPAFQTSLTKLGILLDDDLYFPEQAVALALKRIRVLVVPVAWPAAGSGEGQTLAAARSIESQIYTVVCNRAREGWDGDQHGGSLILDTRGDLLVKAGPKDEIIMAELDLESAYAERRVRSFLKERSPRAYGGERPPPADAYSGLVLSREHMTEEAERLRGEGRRLVFTNGCFDLLHAGHVTYLKAARDLGDALCVGLNTDRSVRGLKGPDRPVQPEADRAAILASLACVDYVVLFDEPTPLDLIRAVQPDVLVKEGDYSPDTVVGRDVVEARGGRVEIIALVPGRSTTALLTRRGSPG